MASFRIVIAESAQAELMVIPFPFRRQVNQRIVKLKKLAVPPASELISVENETSRFKLRVTGWKIIYVVDDAHATITILSITALE